MEQTKERRNCLINAALTGAAAATQFYMGLRKSNLFFVVIGLGILAVTVVWLARAARAGRQAEAEDGEPPTGGNEHDR